MSIINIADAKKNLSSILKRVQRGETLVICHHNKPVAELRPIVARPSKARPAGLCRGDFVVPDDFNAPLPDDMLRTFEPR